MDLNKCADCGEMGSADEMEACGKCRSPLCTCCGTFRNSGLLCKKCLEKEEDAEIEAELAAEAPPDDGWEDAAADMDSDWEKDREDAEIEQ